MLLERFLALPSARIASALSDNDRARMTDCKNHQVDTPGYSLRVFPLATYLAFSSLPSEAMFFNPHSTPNPRQQRVIQAHHSPLSWGPASSRRALCILATTHSLPTSPPRQSLDPAPPINQVINDAINMLSAREASLPKQKIDTHAWPRCAAILPSKPSRPAQSGLGLNHACRLQKQICGDDDCNCDRRVLDCD
ncbi:hypothetical protein BKA80DRAFT_109063 [Phyllosticta citrichinensis]